jgi:hypothetical protein
MNASRDRQLLDALVADLEPVRPTPSPGVRAAAVIASAAICLVAVAVAAGLPLPPLARLMEAPLRILVLAGLAVAGVGGTLAAARGAAPDREAASAGVLGLALGGIALASVACLAVLAGGRMPSGSAPAFPLHLVCLGRSLAVALVPLAVGVVCCVLGWVGSPRRVALCLLVGAGSLGALAIHVLCTVAVPEHLLAGHLAAPALAAVVATLPIAALLRRIAR